MHSLRQKACSDSKRDKTLIPLMGDFAHVSSDLKPVVECGGRVMGKGNLAERGWSNVCLWGGETRPKNPLRGD